MVIKVGSVIYIENIEFSVIGIDHYSLLNVNGQKKKWKSYTLIDTKNKQRVWITRGIGKKFILWHKAKLKSNSNILQQYNLLNEMSGIATINFEGEKGISSSISLISWFTSIINDFGSNFRFKYFCILFYPIISA